MLKRAHRKIAQPQVGLAAFFPNPKQRPVQRLAQEVVAFAHGDPDALAEKAAFDERPAGEGAAIRGIRAVDPERQRDGVAENEIDLAAPKRKPQRVAWPAFPSLRLARRRSDPAFLRSPGLLRSQWRL